MTGCGFDAQGFLAGTLSFSVNKSRISSMLPTFWTENGACMQANNYFTYCRVFHLINTLGRSPTPQTQTGSRRVKEGRNRFASRRLCRSGQTATTLDSGSSFRGYEEFLAGGGCRNPTCRGNHRRPHPNKNIGFTTICCRSALGKETGQKYLLFCTRKNNS